MVFQYPSTFIRQWIAICSKRNYLLIEEFKRKNTPVRPVIKMVQSKVDDRIESLRKQDQIRKLNFAFSFQPIHYISRVYGLMPFSFTYDSDGDLYGVKIWPLDYLWFVVSICLYTLLTLVPYKYLAVKQDPNIPFVLIFTDHMLLMLGLISGAFIISFDIYNRCKFVDVINHFNVFDKEARVILV